MRLWNILKRGGGKNPRKPVVLVTGCASGVGLCLAQRLHKISAYRVVVTCRESSLPRLRKLFKKDSQRFWVRPLDVAKGEERARLVSEINQNWGGVDILINNAGISYRAVVEHMTEMEELKQLRVNYLAPLALMRLVLPYMRGQGRGKIINVSSVSGMLAMPTMSSYSASKHALEGASEALWYEMKPLGIDVTLVQPGFIKSQSFEKVYYTEKSQEAEEGMGPYGDYYRFMSPFIGKMMNRSITTPEQVAQKVIRVIQTENPPLRVPATLDAIVFFYLRRWVPRRIFHPLLFRLLPGAKNWGKSYSKARRYRQKRGA